MINIAKCTAFSGFPDIGFRSLWLEVFGKKFEFEFVIRVFHRDWRKLPDPLGHLVIFSAQIVVDIDPPPGGDRFDDAPRKALLFPRGHNLAHVAQHSHCMTHRSAWFGNLVLRQLLAPPSVVFEVSSVVRVQIVQVCHQLLS